MDGFRRMYGIYKARRNLKPPPQPFVQSHEIQQNPIPYFYRSHAPVLIVIHKCWSPVIPAGIAGIQSTGR